LRFLRDATVLYVIIIIIIILIVVPWVCELPQLGGPKRGRRLDRYDLPAFHLDLEQPESNPKMADKAVHAEADPGVELVGCHRPSTRSRIAPIRRSGTDPAVAPERPRRGEASAVGVGHPYHSTFVKLNRDRYRIQPVAVQEPLGIVQEIADQATQEHAPRRVATVPTTRPPMSHRPTPRRAAAQKSRLEANEILAAA